VGKESFHFVSPSSSSSSSSSSRSNGSRKKIAAHVSYTRPGDGRRFGSLDDGSSLPARAYFKNAARDSSTRTFVASLKWVDDWGSAFKLPRCYTPFVAAA
jgi:hypothetical protein